MNLAALLPRRSDYATTRRSWRADLLAGLTVGVVALPLALGFGVTSGLGAAAGVVTAIVAGLAAAVFGGSDVQVSGPTGAMTVVLVPVVERFGARAVLVVSLVAGAMLVAAAAARIGRYLAYVPWPVVEGFTVGIAVIIFLQQVPPALGVAKPSGENTAAVAVRAVIRWTDSAGVASLGLVAVVVAVMLIVPRIRRGLPASLIAVAVATAVARLWSVRVAVIGSLPSSLPLPRLPSFRLGELGQLLPAAVAVAALGALESLLSAKVADGMSGERRHDPDRELFGQGLANVLSPLFGGMPATGAIARTAVNVRAGARSRLAAITHAVVLICVVYLAGRWVSIIPIPALAGVLVVTAVRMVEPRTVAAVLTSTRADATVFGLTAVATVAFDLIVAVEIGVAAAALLALRSISNTATATAEPVAGLPPMVARPSRGVDESAGEPHADSSRILTYRLDGAFFFGAAQRFLTELTSVSDVDVVILRLPELDVLDATGAHTLGEIVRELEGRGITVLLKGPRAEHLQLLESVGALRHLSAEEHVFHDLTAAIAHAREHVARRGP